MSIVRVCARGVIVLVYGALCMVAKPVQRFGVDFVGSWDALVELQYSFPSLLQLS